MTPTEPVTVLGEAGGLAPGQVSYDAQNWWVVWQPQADLNPGDTYHVTLAKDAVEDLAGNEAEAPTTFTFKTARLNAVKAQPWTHCWPRSFPEMWSRSCWSAATLPLSPGNSQRPLGPASGRRA